MVGYEPLLTPVIYAAPVPSTAPGLPALPASVVTTPSGVTRRIVALPKSVTKRFPAPSIPSPRGWEKRAAEPALLEFASPAAAQLAIPVPLRSRYTTYIIFCLFACLFIAAVGPIDAQGYFSSGSVIAIDPDGRNRKTIVAPELGYVVDDIVFDHFQAAAYPDQPMGRSVLGTVASVRSIGRDALFGYMNENWDEQVKVPIGPDNSFDLLGADLGGAVKVWNRGAEDLYG